MSICKHNLPFSFLPPEAGKLDIPKTEGREKQKIKTANKKLYSTFLSVRKVAKEACTLKRIAKILFRSAKINKLASLKQNLSFNASFHKIFSRNSFNVPKELNLFDVDCFKGNFLILRLRSG